MKYKFEIVKNNIFCLVISLFIVFLPIFIIAVNRYNKQIEEIDKLNTQIENQQMIIDYLKSR